MTRICRELADEVQVKARSEVISTEDLMHKILKIDKKIRERVQRILLARERVTSNKPRLQDLCSTVT